MLMQLITLRSASLKNTKLASVLERNSRTRLNIKLDPDTFVGHGIEAISRKLHTHYAVIRRV